ncbi:hypothetical protein Clacol_008021 [Clathrus columnatus]|uniref:FAD-binding PCMH-type domain-containing protein n=1 Tax=Clathrus columnatus TaxID=1419009 RepID=A0AAV5APD0_9AGAM|nr:hypothetical protein Clacol_008021 [Clathrus columnatus]
MWRIFQVVFYPFLFNPFSIQPQPPQPHHCKTVLDNTNSLNEAELHNFNRSIDGRLLKIIPSGQFCKTRPDGCSDTEWFSGEFRKNIPGSMLQINWEQDYSSDPPSLCFRNSTTCGQGNVSVFGVNATTIEHIQAGILFANRHNLKVTIKASGHDYLGRSTAKGSFLIWTRYLQNVTFHDSFQVEGNDLGSAVTVGSGVELHTLYLLTKGKGKIFVGGTAAGVVASGGYVQGAGHSALSPTFGLAADNALQFEIVIADGSFLTVNSASHSDLFWALRGGGAGSWGVIISTTFRTFPTFSGVLHSMNLITNDSTQAGRLAELHARHIFEWDSFKVGQYFFSTSTPPAINWQIATVFPNATTEDANAAMKSFIGGAQSLGLTPNISVQLVNVNDALGAITSDLGGVSVILGSRLIPADVYRNNPMGIGRTYTELYDSGVHGVLGHLVAGGQVSENQNIHSAINPKWRTAKTHVVIVRVWNDSTPIEEIEQIRQDMTRNQVPILATLAGENSGAYSNEADVREPNFQMTFFGPNYSKLLSIKRKYDPYRMFIVPAGVGSEYSDLEEICEL